MKMGILSRKPKIKYVNVAIPHGSCSSITEKNFPPENDELGRSTFGSTAANDSIPEEEDYLLKKKQLLHENLAPSDNCSVPDKAPLCDDEGVTNLVPSEILKKGLPSKTTSPSHNDANIKLSLQEDSFHLELSSSKEHANKENANAGEDMSNQSKVTADEDNEVKSKEQRCGPPRSLSDIGQQLPACFGREVQRILETQAQTNLTKKVLLDFHDANLTDPDLKDIREKNPLSIAKDSISNILRGKEVLNRYCRCSEKDLIFSNAKLSHSYDEQKSSDVKKPEEIKNDVGPNFEQLEPSSKQKNVDGKELLGDTVTNHGQEQRQQDLQQQVHASRNISAKAGSKDIMTIFSNSRENRWNHWHDDFKKLFSTSCPLKGRGNAGAVNNMNNLDISISDSSLIPFQEVLLLSNATPTSAVSEASSHCTSEESDSMCDLSEDCTTFSSEFDSQKFHTTVIEEAASTNKKKRSKEIHYVKAYMDQNFKLTTVEPLSSPRFLESIESLDECQSLATTVPDAVEVLIFDKSAEAKDDKESTLHCSSRKEEVDNSNFVGFQKDNENELEDNENSIFKPQHDYDKEQDPESKVIAGGKSKTSSLLQDITSRPGLSAVIGKRADAGSGDFASSTSHDTNETENRAHMGESKGRLANKGSVDDSFDKKTKMSQERKQQKSPVDTPSRSNCHETDDNGDPMRQLIISSGDLSPVNEKKTDVSSRLKQSFLPISNEIDTDVSATATAASARPDGARPDIASQKGKLLVQSGFSRLFSSVAIRKKNSGSSSSCSDRNNVTKPPQNAEKKPLPVPLYCGETGRQATGSENLKPNFYVDTIAVETFLADDPGIVTQPRDKPDTENSRGIRSILKGMKNEPTKEKSVRFSEPLKSVPDIVSGSSEIARHDKSISAKDEDFSPVSETLKKTPLSVRIENSSPVTPPKKKILYDDQAKLVDENGNSFSSENECFSTSSSASLDINYETASGATSCPTTDYHHPNEETFNTNLISSNNPVTDKDEEVQATNNTSKSSSTKKITKKQEPSAIAKAQKKKRGLNFLSKKGREQQQIKEEKRYGMRFFVRKRDQTRTDQSKASDSQSAAKSKIIADGIIKDLLELHGNEITEEVYTKLEEHLGDRMIARRHHDDFVERELAKAEVLKALNLFESLRRQRKLLSPSYQIQSFSADECWDTCGI